MAKVTLEGASLVPDSANYQVLAAFSDLATCFHSFACFYACSRFLCL